MTTIIILGALVFAQTVLLGVLLLELKALRLTITLLSSRRREWNKQEHTP